MDTFFDYFFLAILVMIVIFLSIIAGMLVVLMARLWTDTEPRKPVKAAKKK